MWQELRDYWMPLTLFVATLLIAIALALAVLIAPILPFTHPLLDLFAHDETVRRTSLFAAVGLTVTAFVFFRPGIRPRLPRPDKPKQNTVAGA